MAWLSGSYSTKGSTMAWLSGSFSAKLLLGSPACPCAETLVPRTRAFLPSGMLWGKSCSVAQSRRRSRRRGRSN
eukprot:2727063-Lingulodinium_polyedra.AAC.1